MKNPNWFSERKLEIISKSEDNIEIRNFLYTCAVLDGLQEFTKWLKAHNDCHCLVAKSYYDCYAIAFDGDKAFYACSIEDPYNEELF